MLYCTLTDMVAPGGRKFSYEWNHNNTASVPTPPNLGFPDYLKLTPYVLKKRETQSYGYDYYNRNAQQKLVDLSAFPLAFDVTYKDYESGREGNGWKKPPLSPLAFKIKEAAYINDSQRNDSYNSSWGFRGGYNDSNNRIAVIV